LQKALAAEGGAPPVIWLQGQSCTGCAVSFLNSVYYATADDLLINELDVRFQSNVMAAAGDLAVESAEMTRSEGGYILVVEGSTPAGANGEYCHLWEGMTMLEAMKTFAPGADIILAFGTCASYGGIYAAAPNPTGAMGVRDTLDYLGLEGTVINIPGCPAHPDWLVGTVVLLLNGEMPVLDELGRPRDFYKHTVHSRCPNKIKLDEFMEQYGLTGDGLKMDFNLDGQVDDVDLAILDDAGYGLKANMLSDAGCLRPLGCKGPDTHADCPTRKWNTRAAGEQGVNWCVDSRSVCIGCTEPNFPDGMSPFYELEGNVTGPITVRKAGYRVDTRELRVEANSSGQPTEVLTVEGYGVMTWNEDKNKYEYRAKPVADPGDSITVTSDSGASVTKLVAHVGSGIVDTLTIRKAEYVVDKQELRVGANSPGQPDDVLTVDGYGVMTWNSDKHIYQYRARPVADPGETITVTSDSGESVAASVTHTGIIGGIVVRKAEYRIDNRELRVEANCLGQPTEILTVEGYGVMTWNSDKYRYQYRMKPVADPGGSVTVTSSSGGTASSPVEYRD
jgi:hydrogenase small subunit